MPISKKPYLLNKMFDLARKNESIKIETVKHSDGNRAKVTFTVIRKGRKANIELLYDFSDTQRGYVTILPLPLNGISISFTANIIKQVIDKTVHFGFLEASDVKSFHY